MRYFVLALVVCAIVTVGSVAVGRAMDAAVQDRVIFTRGGITLDCERRVYSAGETIVFEDGSSMLALVDGEVHYTDCHTAG